MTTICEKNREQMIIKRIRRLINEGGPVKKTSLVTIAMNSCVEKHTVKSLYEDKPTRKASISEPTAKKLEIGLDKTEIDVGLVKHCPTCNKDLPLGQFHFSKTYPDGTYYQCRECKKKHRRQQQTQKKTERAEGKRKMNNGKEKAITAEIVKRVMDEDKRDVESKFMAPYFGITPKQLDEIRKGQWNNLLYTPKKPEPANTVLASVESLRAEVAGLRREIEAVLIELGIEIKEQ